MDTLNVMKDFNAFSAACGKGFDKENEDVVFLSLEIIRFSNSSQKKTLKRRLVLTPRALYLYPLSTSGRWKGPPKRRLALEHIEAAILATEDSRKVIFVVTADDKDGRDLILSSEDRETLVEAVSIAKDGVEDADPLAVLELEGRHIDKVIKSKGKGKTRINQNYRDLVRDNDFGGGSFRFSMDVSARTELTKHKSMKRIDQLGQRLSMLSTNAVIEENNRLRQPERERDPNGVFTDAYLRDTKGSTGSVHTLTNLDNEWKGKDYDFSVIRCPRANGDLGPVAPLWKRMARTLSILSIPSLSTPKLREIALKLTEITSFNGPSTPAIAIKAICAIMIDRDLCATLIKEMNTSASKFVETLEALTGYADPEIRKWAVLALFHSLPEFAHQSAIPDTPYWTFMLNYNIMDGSYADPNSTTGRDYVPENHPNVVLSELFRDSVWNAELLESIIAKTDMNPDHRRTTVAAGHNSNANINSTSSHALTAQGSNRRQSTVGDMAVDVIRRITSGKVSESKTLAKLRSQRSVKRTMSKESTNSHASERFLDDDADNKGISILSQTNDTDLDAPELNSGNISRMSSSEDGGSLTSGSFRSVAGGFKTGGVSDSELDTLSSTPLMTKKASSLSVTTAQTSAKTKTRKSIFGFTTGMLTPRQSLTDDTSSEKGSQQQQPQPPASQKVDDKTKKYKNLVFTPGRIRSGFARMWLGRLVDLETSIGEFVGIKESDITVTFQLMLDQVPSPEVLFKTAEDVPVQKEESKDPDSSNDVPFEPFGGSIAVPELFLTLSGAIIAAGEDEIRRDGLKNMALLLLRNPRAQGAIIGIPSWQGAVFPVFARIPTDLTLRSENQKKNFQLARHILSTLIAQQFFDSESNVSLETAMNSTCFELATYSGWNEDSVSFLRDIFQGMLNLVVSSTEEISSTWKYEPGSHQWDSLLRLTCIIQVFFFYRPCNAELFISGAPKDLHPVASFAIGNHSATGPDGVRPSALGVAMSNDLERRLDKGCPEWLLSTQTKSLLLPQSTASQFASKSGSVFVYMLLPSLSPKYKGKNIGIHMNTTTGRCEDSGLLSTLLTIWKACGIYGSKDVDAIKIREWSQKKSERAKMQYASSLVSELVSTQKFFQTVSDDFDRIGLSGVATLVRKHLDKSGSSSNGSAPTAAVIGISFLNRTQLGRTVSSRLNIGILPKFDSGSGSSLGAPLGVKITPVAKPEGAPNNQTQKVVMMASKSSRTLTKTDSGDVVVIPQSQRAQKTVMDEAKLEGDINALEQSVAGSLRHLQITTAVEASGGSRRNLLNVDAMQSKRHLIGLQHQGGAMLSTRDIFGAESTTASTIDGLRASLASRDRQSTSGSVRASTTSRLSTAGGRRSTAQSRMSRASNRSSNFGSSGSSAVSAAAIAAAKHRSKNDPKRNSSKSPKLNNKVHNSPGKYSPNRRFRTRTISVEGGATGAKKDPNSPSIPKTVSPARRNKNSAEFADDDEHFDLDGQPDVPTKDGVSASPKPKHIAAGPATRKAVEEEMGRLGAEFKRSNSVVSKREMFKHSKDPNWNANNTKQGSSKGFRRPSDLAAEIEIDKVKTASEKAIEANLKRLAGGFRRSSQFDLDTKSNIVQSAMMAASRGIAANISRQKAGFRRPSTFDDVTGAPKPEFLGLSSRNVGQESSAASSSAQQPMQTVHAVNNDLEEEDIQEEDDVVRLTNASFCVRCRKACVSSVLTISRFGEQWHDQCFICSHCGVHIVEKALLDTARYFEDVQLLVCGQACKNAIVRISNEPGMPPRCTSCLGLFDLDEVAFEACGGHWHAEHFCCVSCGETFKDDSAEYFEKDGMPWCPTCFKAEFEEANSCMNCGVLVTDSKHFPDKVELFGRVWCSQKHFVCTACGDRFKDGRYFFGGEDKDDKMPYCEKHYFERFVPPCKRCGLFLNAETAKTSVTVGDTIVFHAHCLACSVCNKELTHQTAVVHQASRRVFCQGCSPDNLAVSISCDACGEPIEGSYVTAMDNEGMVNHGVMFHTSCFVCSETKCKRTLVDVDYYWGEDPVSKKARPYCESHAVTKKR